VSLTRAHARAPESDATRPNRLTTEPRKTRKDTEGTLEGKMHTYIVPALSSMSCVFPW